MQTFNGPERVTCMSLRCSPSCHRVDYEITFLHMGFGGSALYIRIATGTLMRSALVPFEERVSSPCIFPPSLLAVCDEVVKATMLKEIAAVQSRGH